MVEIFPDGFTLKEAIRIPNKTFTDLSIFEIALMIEADSSLTENGNEYFAACALDEFLNNASLDGRSDLQQIKNDILKNIYVDVPGRQAKEINTEFLIKYAQRLRMKHETAL